MVDPCDNCGTVKTVLARGLCGACYKRLRRHGSLTVRKCSRLADVDEIAVERACRGDAVMLTVRERAAAVALMTARGLSAREIGRRLGLASRTVHRYRMGEQVHGKAA